MELTITGDLARQILAASRKDSQLEEAMARHYLAAIDPYSMATYLLTSEVAQELLAARLRANPVETIDELQALPERDQPLPKQQRRKQSVRKGARPGKKAAKKKARGGRTRRRLTPEQALQLKAQVKDFLGRNGWSSRKELTAAVALDTQAIYRRIMDELQQEGIVAAKGQKSMARYGLKGTRAAAGAKKQTRSKSVKRAG